jgi:hypothetical protein
MRRKLRFFRRKGSEGDSTKDHLPKTKDCFMSLTVGLIPRKVYRAPKEAGTLRLFELVLVIYYP